MRKEEQLVSDEEMDALMQEAELEAQADAPVAIEEEKNEDESEDAEEQVSDEDRYICPLLKEYNFTNNLGEKETIQELDLSGLEDLKTKDLEHFDRVLAKMNHYPQNKYKDTVYCKHVAMRVTGLPVDFFNMLSARDMILIASKVYSYFLFG